jgi:hypothetical protein
MFQTGATHDVIPSPRAVTQDVIQNAAPHSDVILNRRKAPVRNLIYRQERKRIIPPGDFS